ncbi:hypothetical protein MB46_13930 [Arthrobacter alpinus]|uniref:hypothetical protein n=1 Tax=Arthrobacter alpinus TaxID=656366 RepID=UPI0006785D5A|nr:hypothetical protein [Arthrobacter alpinus]ALV46421.1 hypothetical protein MB46_13930 [Arthrobacter alpinus]
MDASWPLSVALYVRDALGLAATKPFFVPPVVPEVPEQIPATGPLSDVVLAGEWAHWFADLVRTRNGIRSLDELLLEDRHPELQDSVQQHFIAAQSAAELFKVSYHDELMRSGKNHGAIPSRLVRTIEKELGRRASPFELAVRVVPVQGQWLHRPFPKLVLMSSAAQFDSDAQFRLLGPILRELAS